MAAAVLPEHKQRIKQELIKAGVTRYALLKMESRYLPQVIHASEHIGAAAYGRKKGAGGSMLVATDKRVIFLDRKPLFVTVDELSYHIVSGVKVANQGLLTSLTLHTRIGDYTLLMANPVSANKFANYIEKAALQQSAKALKKAAKAKQDRVAVSINRQVATFLNQHEVAVFSTLDRTGSVHGAAVYYLLYSPHTIYVVTKTTTNKAQNLLSHGQVSLTVYDKQKLQTVQIRGWAEPETDQILRDDVFSKLVKPRDYTGEERLPPISQLNAGDYMVIKITPSSVKYVDYKDI